jgi:hypothetical protein
MKRGVKRGEKRRRRKENKLSGDSLGELIS